jgi:hypothetical protein
MRPLFAVPARAAAPAGTADDIDDTVSYSSDEEQADPPILQQLAVTLIGWEPTLVTAYARLDPAAADIAPFAEFLARLLQEVSRREAVRGEIVGWLQALATDEAARKRAFGIIAAADGAGTALATYQAIRAA